MSEVKPIKDLIIDSYFSELFKIDDQVLANIMKSIEENGYDEEEPIVIWQEEGCIVDGHTRVEACVQTGRKKIPVSYRSFENKEAALSFAIRKQMDRRNLTEEQLILIRRRFGYNTPGGNPKKQKNTNQEFAERVGISKRKALDVSLVSQEGTEEQLEEIYSGKTSVVQTAKKIREKKRKGETENKFSKSGKMDCPYARWIWLPGIDSLDAPANTTPLSSTSTWSDLVAVCPTEDILDDSIEKVFINAVLTEINKSPQFKYLIHTQNYKRLEAFSWPDNVILGSKISSQTELNKFIRVLSKKSIIGGQNFIILDPFIEIDISDAVDKDIIHWVIVGNYNNTEVDWNRLFDFVNNCGKAQIYFMPEVYIQPKEIIQISEAPLEEPEEPEEPEEAV